MASSPFQILATPSHVQLYRHFHGSTLIPRCCRTAGGENARPQKINYYELLGVSVNSNRQEIKEAYRKLQKRFHPDVAGQEGHQYTMKLNEAYRVLGEEALRREYDSSLGQMTSDLATYSSWNGPFTPHALFVDPNACIGCRECVHHASKTFIMDESLGFARVKLQCGDDTQDLQLAIDSCPVNCIHVVNREELPILELLVQPQPREGYGVFGQGWERPSNIFMAAKAYDKQLKQQAEQQKRHGRRGRDKESRAQAEARAYASMKLRMEGFSKIWNWVQEICRLSR